MREGALGVSSSLQYVPDMYNSTEELDRAWPKVAARYGGAYFTHQRSEANAHRLLARRGLPDRAGSERSARRSGTSRPRTSRTGAACPPCSRGSRRAARGRASTSAANQYPWTARLERARRVPAALDPRGRPRGAVEAPRRSRDRGKAREADMVEDSDAWEQPVPGRRRPGPRARRVRPQPEARRSTRARRSPRSRPRRRRTRATP